MNSLPAFRRSVNRPAHAHKRAVTFVLTNATQVSSQSSVVAIRLRKESNSPQSSSSRNIELKNKMDYQNWTKERLLERVKELEAQLKSQSQSPPSQPTTTTTITTTTTAPSQPKHPVATTPTVEECEPPKKKQKKISTGIDPSRYTTRLIALKLSYLGKNYGGFEYSGSGSLPSIEEELWKALVKGCLITPAADPTKIDFSPFEYSKCGRTDRGVSAFGQVISIRVRSNKLPPLKKEPEQQPEEDIVMEGTPEQEQQQQVEQQQDDTKQPGKKQPKKSKLPKKSWEDITDEINYPKVLNRLLPPDIKVLAWAPTLPEGFSARFSCYERQYRYFFTNPSMPPTILSPGEKSGWLDIPAMKKAAKYFEGLHDFRNFCKVDGGKQISNFQRRIFECDIEEVQGQDLGGVNWWGQGEQGKEDKVYYFHVRGSAFLWHQIRHMVAIVFNVGQGLEEPEIVKELLDTEKNGRKPGYIMAEEVPLVLWDCIFPKRPEAVTEGGKKETIVTGSSEDERSFMHNPNFKGEINFKDDGVDWVWLGEDQPGNLMGSNGLVDQLWEYWHERKMDELLSGLLLQQVATRADLSRKLGKEEPPPRKNGRVNLQRVYKGGHVTRSSGVYVPVMKKELMPTPVEINHKWAQAKGFKDSEDMANTKNWRSVIKANKAAEKAAVAAAGGAEKVE
ncbi:pseudouridine synthase [Triangularia setosa]|uniref:Pseudouridine synthase n=1 Tax=Triangularia setosa TaxID=2587417 RepID=A0AAN6WF29_9PEZI|nr:pseudouridine synthase [Podospora setosa]